MAQRFVCSRGHEWDPPVDSASGGTSPLCPQCLAPGTPRPEADNDRTRDFQPGAVVADALPFTEPPSGPPVPLAVATVPAPEIPGYDILGSLARGGLGMVYKARHRALGRIVAIKVIRPDLISQADVVRRFRREAKAAARLTHPNIVSVHDADEAAGIPYIVMEFIEGIDLAHLVEQRGRLPISWASDFTRQAALGLQHAHERGLVHRDVKPSNLIIMPAPAPPDPAGREPVESPASFTVKVVDLGVARVLAPTEESGGLTVLTQAGGIVGTPDYMAPEQVENAHLVDIRADVYSLGATLYFLLTGQPPFPEMGFYQKLARLQLVEPTPVENLRSGVPPALAAIVRKAMAKLPANRFATPADLAAALEKVADGNEALTATPGAADATAIGQVKFDGTTVPRVLVGGPIDTMSLASRRLLGHTDWVTAVAYSADGERLVSGGHDGTLRLWDPSVGQELTLLRPDGGGVNCVAFLPQGLALVVGCRDGSLYIWNGSKEKNLRRVEAHVGGILSLAVTPDGRRVVTAGQDQTLKLWSLESGRLKRRLGGQVVERHWDAVLSVVVLPDGRRAVSGSRDLTLKLWDLETGRELRSFRGPRAEVACVAVTPDGLHALSGGGNRLRWWPLDGGESQSFKGHEAPIRAVAIAPDGRLAASGGEDLTLRLWEIPSGRQVHFFTGNHQGTIHSLAFSPDGRWLAAGGADRMVHVWQVPRA